MTFFKSRGFQLGAAALLGAAFVLAANLCLPLLGRAIYESDFRTAYVDCAFAEQHTARFKGMELKPSLRVQLERALEVERLRCLDYAALNLPPAVIPCERNDDILDPSLMRLQGNRNFGATLAAFRCCNRRCCQWLANVLFD